MIDIHTLPRLRLEQIDNAEHPVGCYAEGETVLALALRDSDLTQLPDAIRQLPHLRQLDLTGNHLTALPDWLGDLVYLERLFLDRNRLNALPESIGSLTRLAALHADRDLAGELGHRVALEGPTSAA